MDKDMKTELEIDWCDLLGQYTLHEVEGGAKALFEATDGKLRSINEYQVQKHIKLAHAALLEKLPKKIAPPEPERDFSPETVARRRALSDELLGDVKKSLTAAKQGGSMNDELPNR